MKIQLSPFHFNQLMEWGYSLDHIFILKLIDEGIDIEEMIGGSVKIAALYQSLIRKVLVFENERKLTAEGKDLILFLSSKEEKKTPRVKSLTTEFDEWWAVFPSTDTFEYKGKKFAGSRGLKQAKDDCRAIFSKILKEGEHTKDQLIEALKLDISQKKEKSYQTSTNKLSYMQNSATYLRQRSYEPFIELIKSGIKTEEQSKWTGAIDI